MHAFFGLAPIPPAAGGAWLGRRLERPAGGGAGGRAAGSGQQLTVVRGGDLTRLMVTLGIGLMLFEAANKAAFLTGGVDGLSGVSMGSCSACSSSTCSARPPTCTAWQSPSACSCAAPADPVSLRARCAGCAKARGACRRWAWTCRARLRAVYTLAAAIAAVAGGLLAQTTQFVGMDALGFPRSAELLVMLVLGGTGRLYGVPSPGRRCS